MSPICSNPDVDLHVVLDNYGTHKHPEVRAWVAEPAGQRVTLHFTPAGCSWLNMEIFFGIITRQAIRRGTFRTVKDLTAAIGRFIDACNQRCQPFAWTKHADELIAKASRPSSRPPGGSPSGSAP
jgi:transposase